MLIGIFTDVHWSSSTSILRIKDEQYSRRLNLLISGMNWAFDLFDKLGCKMAVCAGDFFDKDACNEEELTALLEIDWKNVPTCFIVGNHESSRADLSVSSTSALESQWHVPGVVSTFSNVINKPYCIDYLDTQMYFLPYVTESDRKSIKEYLKGYDPSKKHIIFSHNDLKDVQYGPYLNKTGFSVGEIEEVADLYLNGHIHNGQWITRKILDLGSMSAHNFTNDSKAYRYGVWVLDTDTLEMRFFENPYSLNFYKFDIDKEADLAQLDSIKGNAMLSLKCLDSLKDNLDAKLSSLSDRVLVHRTTYYRPVSGTANASECTLAKSDHLEQFRAYVIATIGETEVVKEELNEICK